MGGGGSNEPQEEGEARSFVAGRGSELRDGCRCNGEVEGRVEGELTPIKLKMLRIKQNSENSYSFLVAMNCASVQKQKNGTGVLASAKAVSVHALSKNKFLILDSVGDLHVLSLRNKAVPSGITDQCSLTSKEAHTYRLDHPMKIQLLAVLPNTSTKTQVVWVSDGGHTVHMMSLSDIEYSVGGNVEEERKSTMIQISAIEAIFVSEKVRDIVPISSNAVLVLGQGIPSETSLELDGVFQWPPKRYDLKGTQKELKDAHKYPFSDKNTGLFLVMSNI
ncbi:hypothetical protein ACMD2_25167 [Ananas comosus]|uniref:Uncharacterized protein n=1 Tax=Ananas comosus TaxID=4615 RepID=A0A199VT70_ANACO|nr:hypothetical protein ACMD2_25167 [Ananas comosus]